MTTEQIENAIAIAKFFDGPDCISVSWENKTSGYKAYVWKGAIAKACRDTDANLSSGVDSVLIEHTRFHCSSSWLWTLLDKIDCPYLLYYAPNPLHYKMSIWDKEHSTILAQEEGKSRLEAMYLTILSYIKNDDHNYN